jgi:hypothetical protein
MVAEPANTPDTIPELSIVATAILLLLQLPPDTISDRLVVAPPAHTIVVPCIVPALGNGFTVNAAVATDVPQLLVYE